MKSHFPTPLFFVVMTILSLFAGMYDAILLLAIAAVFYFFGRSMIYGAFFAAGCAFAAFKRLFLGTVAAKPSASVRPNWSAVVLPSGARIDRKGQRPEPLRTGVVVRGVRSRVIDGDSVEFKIDNGATLHVRLRGIDAPEHGCPGANFAMLHLNELLCPNGAPARVTIQSFGADFYSRTLAILYVGDRSVNAAMVLRGAAWASQCEAAYQAHQAAARQAKRGIWSMDSCDVVPPWEVRRARKATQRTI